MNEVLEKLIFTNVHFKMSKELENDAARERRKAKLVYNVAQKICPIRQSWSEKVPITFEPSFE